MANAKEIKGRMESIRETQKITGAMYMIASNKMRKAKSELERTRPYFTALQREIKRIFHSVPHLASTYFYPNEGSHEVSADFGYLVITADKGLAGAYNQNVIKEAMAQLEKNKGAKLYVVGEYGRSYFMSHNCPIEKSFLYTAQNPTFMRAREIAGIILDAYEKGEIGKFFIIYSDFENGISSSAKNVRLLPLHTAEFEIRDEDEKPIKDDFEFLPSVLEVVDSMIPSYVAGFIYSALVDSFCCEQNARMTAMDSANRNADEILSGLKRQYNHIRQQAITQEITEVSTGAKYQRKKREKKEVSSYAE